MKRWKRILRAWRRRLLELDMAIAVAWGLDDDALADIVRRKQP